MCSCTPTVMCARCRDDDRRRDSSAPDPREERLHDLYEQDRRRPEDES